MRISCDNPDHNDWDAINQKLDCANKESMAGTGLCDGRASYCHTCVEAATRVCNNALTSARERLAVALLQISEMLGALKACAAGEGGHNHEDQKEFWPDCPACWVYKFMTNAPICNCTVGSHFEDCKYAEKRVEKTTEEKITVREACRKRIPIGPADAEALEHGLTQLEAENKKLRGMYDAAMSERKPIPMILRCPTCGESHVDKGEWATKPHRTHRCEHCAGQWRPSHRATVGVASLGPKTPMSKAVDTCPEH